MTDRYEELVDYGTRQKFLCPREIAGGGELLLVRTGAQ